MEDTGGVEAEIPGGAAEKTSASEGRLETCLTRRDSVPERYFDIGLLRRSICRFGLLLFLFLGGVIIGSRLLVSLIILQLFLTC